MSEATKIHNIIVLSNKKFNPAWQEGDPADTKERSLKFPVPEDAYNAEIRETQRGYVISYDQREERQSPETLILDMREERFFTTKHFLNSELEEEAQWVRYQDWMPMLEKRLLPADYKQPANSWS